MNWPEAFQNPILSIVPATFLDLIHGIKNGSNCCRLFAWVKGEITLDVKEESASWSPGAKRGDIEQPDWLNI